ncbi:hypothetical protein, partial [Vibrio campbellii]|uniref:hypothetical protein n=1 Tax=Vibrio campbellii TaxID=680 RepID=UPI001E48E69C
YWNSFTNSYIKQKVLCDIIAIIVDGIGGEHCARMIGSLLAMKASLASLYSAVISNSSAIASNCLLLAACCQSDDQR